jgi:hypothetical protein
MKTHVFVLSFFLLSQFTLVKAQHTGHSAIVTYPIPSYDITVTALGYAAFEEGYSDFRSDQAEGKRLFNIKPKPLSTGSSECTITAWVFTLDRQTILGPYTVSCDDLLSVDIDTNLWGCLVEAGNEVTVDVWIGDGGSSPLRKVSTKNPPSF